MKKVKVTEAELEILKILWAGEGLTVRQINDIQNEAKKTGYTTTLKMLQIMTEKHLVTRNTDSKVHVYKAAVQKGQIQNSLLNKLIDTAFDGSAMKLVVQALGNHSVHPDEIEYLKTFIQQYEEGHESND